MVQVLSVPIDTLCLIEETRVNCEKEKWIHVDLLTNYKLKSVQFYLVKGTIPSCYKCDMLDSSNFSCCSKKDYLVY